MVRLMLVLAPIACVLAAIGITSVLEVYFSPDLSTARSKKSNVPPDVIPRELSIVVAIAVSLLLVSYTYHCTFITSEAYSSPSIVLAAGRGPGMVIFDDFREGYRWLRDNTAPDARVMSWWDYGYQICAMANRTVLVDNNTWNNTHIAQVGRAMASNESDAYEIMQALDVDYVLVIFGGLTGYSGDDINKFLWMVRIAGGVFPWIKEPDYFTPRGEYRVDAEGAPALLNSLMYKLSYYRFGSTQLEPGKPTGFDRVRNAEIGNKKIKLEHLQEVYTSDHWLVRIYKVLPRKNRTWKPKK